MESDTTYNVPTDAPLREPKDVYHVIDLSKIPVPLSCTKDPLNEREENPSDYEILLASTWNKAVDTLGPDGNDLGQLKTHIADLKEELKEEKTEHQRNWELAEEDLQLALRKRFPDANRPELEAVANWVITSLGRLGPSFIEENTTPPRLWNEIQNPDRWRGFARQFSGRKQRISALEFLLAVYEAVRKKYASPEGVPRFPDPEELRAQSQEIPHSNSESENQKETTSPDPLEDEEEDRAARIPADVFKTDHQSDLAEILINTFDDNALSIKRMRDLEAEVDAKGKKGESIISYIQSILLKAGKDAGIYPIYHHRNVQDFIWVLRIANEKYKVTQGYK